MAGEIGDPLTLRQTDHVLTCYTGGMALATFHLYGVHGFGLARAVAGMALERFSLRKMEGLRFFKLLGTGDGRTFTLRDADPHRWGMFAVWDSDGALHRYEKSTRWARFADESWCAELAPVRWNGRWARRDPFAGGDAGSTPGGDGRVAALTRARVRPSQWRSFWRSVPPVAAAASHAPGRQFAVGIGESPIGLQGTFTMWESEAALRAFAYADEAHRRVIQITRERNWYSEELFVRFSVVRTRGTIDGVAL